MMNFIKVSNKVYLPKLKTLLGDHILGEVIDKPKSLAQYVVELLNKHNEKITLAESCTGGLIASLITQVSGASSVFEAGIVSYSNDIKSQILGVNKATLEQNIDSWKAKIAQAEADIEQNISDQEEKTNELGEQRTILEQIRERLAELRAQ